LFPHARQTGASADILYLYMRRCGAQPWVELLQKDLSTLRSAYASKLADLGDPIADAQKWCLFAQSFPKEWCAIVGNLLFRPSPYDAASAPNLPLFYGDRLRLSCPTCAQRGVDASFASSKALRAHQRAKHGTRNPLRVYLDGSGICPVCHVNFGARTRVLIHVTDQRVRGRCTDSCGAYLAAGHLPALPPEAVTDLDKTDGRLRKEARRLGRTQPRALAPAKRRLRFSVFARRADAAAQPALKRPRRALQPFGLPAAPSGAVFFV